MVDLLSNMAILGYFGVLKKLLNDSSEELQRELQLKTSSNESIKSRQKSSFLYRWEMVGFASTFWHDLIRELSSSRVLQLIKAVISLFWTFWFS